MQRLLLARVIQSNAPAEEEQQIFFRRTEPCHRSRVAGNVAEVEDAGVLEEELALLGEEQAELREIDLLLVGFGLREVGIDRRIEGQRRRDAGLEVDAGGDDRDRNRASPTPRTAPAARNGLMRRLRPCRSAGKPASVPADDARKIE